MGATELTDHDLRKIARITGLEVHQSNTGVYGYEPKHTSIRLERVVVSVGLTHTPDDFLKANLERLRRQLLREQVYRCAQCGRITVLQLHHRKHRSEQRDDRIENLEMICIADHSREHGQ